jgi:hypothetical protein
LSILSSSKLNQTYIQDSKLETFAIRHLRVETQGLNKSTNAIANACANAFLSRTSIPYYHGEQNAYPFQSPTEKSITSKAKDVWVYLRESSGSINHSLSRDFSRNKEYFSVPVRVNLLVESGLLDRASAAGVMKKIYPYGVLVPGFQRGNPKIQSGFGSELHTLGDPADRIHLAAIACRGAFLGSFHLGSLQQRPCTGRLALASWVLSCLC